VLRLDFDLDRLVDEVATRVAAELADRIVSQAPQSPWMAMDEAIVYTRGGRARDRLPDLRHDGLAVAV